MDFKSTNENQKEFLKIIENSVARLSIVINYDKLTNKGNLVDESKEIFENLRNYQNNKICDFLKGKIIDKSIVPYQIMKIEYSSLPAYIENMTDELKKQSAVSKYLSTNYFYPTFQIQEINDGWKQLVVFIPSAFINEGIKGVDKKNRNYYADNINYFTKYFWHTYIHNATQGINESNFRLFKGEARVDSDFIADSAASYLLLLSYGVPIISNQFGDLVGDENNQVSKIIREAMIGIFKRNRCNTTFVNRESSRDENSKNNDTNFLFRRNLLNYLTGFILAEGFMLEDVKIFLSDPSLKIIFRVDDRFFHTEFTARTERKSPSSQLDSSELIIIYSRNENKKLFREISTYISSMLKQEFLRNQKNKISLEQFRHHLIKKYTGSECFAQAFCLNLITKEISFNLPDDEKDKGNPKAA